MARDTGLNEERLPSATLRPVAWAALFMLLGGALVAAGTGVWMVAAGREPSDDPVTRVLFAGLSVALTGVAGLRFFWDASRTRHPRWQRTYAVLVLLWAAYMLVLAIRGV